MPAAGTKTNDKGVTTVAGVGDGNTDEVEKELTELHRLWELAEQGQTRASDAWYECGERAARLYRVHKLTQKKIGERVGRPQERVSEVIRAWEKFGQQSTVSGRPLFWTAVAGLPLDTEQTLKLVKEVKDGKPPTQREVKRRAARPASGPKPSKPRKPPETKPEPWSLKLTVHQWTNLGVDVRALTSDSGTKHYKDLTKAELKSVRAPVKALRDDADKVLGLLDAELLAKETAAP